MRVAIYGSGGVGGYFGARLAAAGHEVHFIARGAHLRAILDHGLRVESAKGDVTVKPAQVHEHPAPIGPVDAVMLTVKLWDVGDAAERLRPLLGAGTVVMPFQNGVEAPEVVAAAIGPEHVVKGVAYIATSIRAPGVIAHTGTMERLLVGPGGEAFVAACRDAGVNAEGAPDIERALWEKFVFLAALSGVTAVARQPVGVCRADPELRATLEAAMREAWRLGRARGVALDEGFVAERMGFLGSLHADMRTSMQHDLEHGNRLEAPWLCGAVARMSEEAGLEAPVSRTLYGALKPYAGGRG